MSEETTEHLIETTKEILVRKILNQLEQDFEEQEYDSIDELLTNLLDIETNIKLFENYLSDEV